MAKAASNITIEWRDEDRWTLDQVLHYLKTLGYTVQRALDEMEQARLDRRLVIQVHTVVEGKAQVKYLPPDKKHKLFFDLGFVRPMALKWSDGPCTVYKQRVLELWPHHLPASQQTEDKTAPDPSAATQRRTAKASKPDSDAERSRKPSDAQVDRNAAINRLLKNGDRPPSNVTWPKFCQAVRVGGDGFIGDPKDEKYKYGFTDDTIEEVTRDLMKLLPR